jgi:hypothetical protein
MQGTRHWIILLAILAVGMQSAGAQGVSSASSTTRTSSSSSTTSSTSSGNSSSTTSHEENSSTTVQNKGGSQSFTLMRQPAGASQPTSVRPPDTGVFTIPSEKPSITFIPKFKQRINDLGEQIRLAQTKGFISGEESARFLDRQAKLLLQEAEVSQKGFPKPDLDTLEKAVTLLNSDLFAAMRKSDPVKPGTAEKETNDANLIPAYPDPELQPGSGKLPDSPK